MRFSASIFTLFVATVLASCGGGALTSSGSSAGAGSGSGSGSGGVNFTMGDMNGDWTGEMIPANPAQTSRNFYIRVDNGVVTDCAEGFGSQWNPSTANITMDFTNQGYLDIAATSFGADGDCSIQGTMNLAMNMINGTARVLHSNGTLFEGTFELRRSTGPGHFNLGLIKGLWNGRGANSRDKFRLASIDVDANGVVQTAEVVNPSNSNLVHTYSPGAGVLAYFDDSIGRMNNVVLTADDGSTLSFDFLLINDLGTLITGPGVDSTLGSGHIELTH